MPSSLKALVHTVATYLALYIGTYAGSSHTLELSVGGVLALILNFVISHTVATTTGRSAQQ